MLDNGHAASLLADALAHLPRPVGTSAGGQQTPETRATNAIPPRPIASASAPAATATAAHSNAASAPQASPQRSLGRHTHIVSTNRSHRTYNNVIHDRAANHSAGAGPSVAAQDVVAFARCMREHGQNVPDPKPGEQWRPARDIAKDDPAWAAAFEACGHLLKAGDAEDEPATPTAEQLEQLRAFAKCMREHGVEMSDPDRTGQTQCRT